MTPPRSSLGHLGRVILGWASLIAVAGACSSAATPVATLSSSAPEPSLVATVSATPTAAVTVEVTATPTQTPSAEASVVPPPPKPLATAASRAPSATVSLPNLTGTSPWIKPASPTCGVLFTVTISMGNKGLGPTNAEAVGVLTISRVEAGGDRLLTTDTFTIPALAAGDGRWFVYHKRLTLSGHFNATYSLDETMVVRESREDDNVLTQPFDIPFGPDCSKA